jgi:ArsR family transcriptional regulator, arsenate/arsenite/antimonite-responsive transcriptional repressor
MKERAMSRTVTVQAADVDAPCGRPIGKPTITDAEATDTAELFKALAHPHRVKILNLLAVNGDTLCVLEIAAVMNLSQPNASHHLKLLTQAGLLTREQRGTWAYYGLNRDALAQLATVITTDELRGTAVS